LARAAPNQFDVSIIEPKLPTVLLVLIVAVATSTCSLYVVGRRQRHLLGLLLASLSIVALSVGIHSGVAMKYGIISDRYAHATLIGLLLCGAALANCYEYGATQGTVLLQFARRWGAVAFAFSILPLTWARDNNWHDETSLQLAMVASRPEDPETWLAVGMMYFGQGNIEEAYPHCRAYADARTQSHKANLCIGVWLLLHSKPAEAVAIIQPEAQTRPGNVNIRRIYMAALIANNDFSKAHRTLDEWSRMFPDAQDLTQAKVTLLSSQQRAEGSLAATNP